MRVLLGSVIVLAVVSSSAEARKVYYDINGKRYSYSTNNRAEAARARERIAAAKAAKAAKAKAEEEVAKHPLVKALGSTTQREARLAQEKLDELLDGPSSTEARKSSPERWALLKEKRKDDGTDEQATKAAASAPVPHVTAAVLQEPAHTPPILVAAPLPPVAEPAGPSFRTKIRSISFDVETGIKTTVMIDGAVEEEPFDSGVLAHIASEQGQANSLVAFVKKLRKVASDEATGSIMAGAARPGP
ncbi:hypothetical protein [Microvirga sp. M2]|uniref:hypothetical protein n=1 Tax=Microvirga sp. M2 TaxID=3073270 RepID=UPI0039C27979